MAKVTSKFQVTVPKTIATRYGIQPGDEIEWVPAGEAIRVIPAQALALPEDSSVRVRLFDQATKRQSKRRRGRKQQSADRGWTRKDLYSRGRSR